MDTDFRFFPERASANAADVDYLYFYLIAVTAVFTLLIFGLIAVFCIRFRRRPGNETGRPVRTRVLLEVAWIVIPLGLALVMFFWGASAFFPNNRAPADSLDVYVVARQWMWKLQHSEGPSEINELHVPVGRSIRLLMTSQDVIHSFYVPAFRLKQDVLPGRYTTLWFRTTRPGEFALYCAEYCGTKHSAMGGRVVVLSPEDYQRWLESGRSQSSTVARGMRLFLSLGCADCHRDAPDARGPSLTGLLGSRVLLQDGREIVADESYLRESILDPAARLVAGYQPLMPVFRGRISEEDLLYLVAYLRSLRSQESRAVER
jgi:cytochrome c oxidase subunit 2